MTVQDLGSRDPRYIEAAVAHEYLAARRALKSVRRSNTPGAIRRARLRVIRAARALATVRNAVSAAS